MTPTNQNPAGEPPCANCGHVTDDVLSCWCACHKGVCRICRRPEVEHRDRNGHGFVAVEGEPPHRAAWSGSWRDEDNAPTETDDGQANDCTHASASGIDTTPLRDPNKVWQCDHCGLRWTSGSPQAPGGKGVPWTESHDDFVSSVAFAERWRQAIASIGYGDNKTEPQISPEEFVREFERIDTDAAEWRESQQWRIECHLAGHPDDQDCVERDPTIRDAAERGRE